MVDGDDDRVGDGNGGVGRGGGDGDVEVDLTATGNDDDTMCAIESDMLILFYIISCILNSEHLSVIPP